MLALVAATPAGAEAPLAGPPEGPILRIETGQHAAPVNQLAVDRHGRFVATASDDKTVRLWSLPDGRLLDTLRVPIGPGLEGALYTAALSPDGSALVAAGYTGPSWDGMSACLYLFDLDQHRLKGRLPNIPAVVTRLAYSPDGKVIVATLFGTAGLRVWEAATGKSVAADPNYGGSGSALAFDPAGGLVVAALDGQLRRYNPDFTLRDTVRLTGGRRPSSLAFSPDGSLLAVGYEDLRRVEVLWARDLSLAYAPSLAGLGGGSLGAVAWVPGPGGDLDLAAAGTVGTQQAGFVVRRWAGAGRGAARDVVVARDTLMDLQPGPGGALLFASAEPAWGMLDSGGRVSLANRGGLADFHDLPSGRFAISADGLTVEFGTARGGRDPVRFDARAQEMGAAVPYDPALTPPLTRHPRLRVESWRNNPAPRLASGVRLPLGKGESALSLAIAPDGGRALIGGDYALHLYDAAGREVQTRRVPGAAWGVAIAGNGRLAVAALGDGTLRWYDLAPGHELEERAALFLADRGRSWVAWIPEGFFSHSPGGERLVGYHLNHGRGKPPEFIPIDQTYQAYYSPRLVALKLEGDPTGELARRVAAVGDASAAIASRPTPRVELVEYCPDGGACRPIVAQAPTRDYRRSGQTATPDLSPLTADLPAGTRSVRLRFRVTDQGGGVGGIDLVQDDKIAATTRDYRRERPAAGDGLLERDLTLPGPGRTMVRVKAFEAGNGRFTLSPPIGFTLAAAAPPPPPRPRLFVIAAGVDAYQSSPLGFPVADAGAFLAALKAQASPHYSGGVIDSPLLRDEQVTLPGLAAAFDRVAAQHPGAEDRVVVYLAGHGIYDPAQGGYVFITWDADRAAARSSRPLSELGLGQATLLANMAKVAGAGSILLLLDTCHAGAGGRNLVNLDPGGAADGQAEGIDKIRQSLGDKVLVLSAASGDETAADVYHGVLAPDFTNRHGIFAAAVLDGLRGGDGRIADRSGDIDAIHFGLYVRRQMTQLVRENNEILEKKGGRPNPQRANFKPNESLADDFLLTRPPTGK